MKSQSLDPDDRHPSTQRLKGKPTTIQTRKVSGEPKNKQYQITYKGLMLGASASTFNR